MSTRTQVNSFFTPTQISGCQLWLDAADSRTITLNGTSVTQWRDKVSNITMTTQGTTNNATILNGINGVQCIYLNNSASDSVYMSGTLANLLTGTAFYVFQSFSQRTVSWRPFATWFSGGQYPAYGYLGSTTVNTVGPYTTFASPNGTPTQVLTPGTNYIISYGWSGTTTYVTTNGSALQTGSQQSYSSSTSTFWIGADGTGATERTTLYYGEMIFYNSVLTTPQRQQVEGYLAWKWGLQANLPANHPYKSSPIPPLLSPPTTVPRVLQNPSFVNWSPLQISGCQLWLDAADISTFTLSGSNVLTWRDKSGNGYGATTPSGTITRTATINSVPVITFGNQSYLTISSFVQNFSYYSVFFVMRSTTALTSGNFNFVLWVNTTGVLNTGIVNDTGTYLVISGKSGQFIMRGNLGSSPQNQTLMISEVTTGNTATQYINNNGTPLTLTTNVTGTLDAVTSSINVGGMPFSSSTGYDLGEVLVYNNSFTTAQREQIEGYLAWKWGLSANLPSAHPYKNLAPSITAVPIRPLAQTISASWQPTQISGCQLWLDAADRNTLILSGSNVTQWRDKSGSGNNATGGVSPTFSNNTIVFNGTTQFLTLPSITSFPSNESWFVVFQFTGSGTNRGWNLLGSSAVTGGRGMQVYRVTTDYNFGADKWGLGTIAFTPILQNTTYLGEFTYSNGPTNGVFNVYLNGSITSLSPQTTSFSGTGSTNLGVGSGGAFFWQGSISEVVSYNSSVSLVQRQNVEGYLAWKWGLQGSLPANHPFKNWPPAP